MGDNCPQFDMIKYLKNRYDKSILELRDYIGSMKNERNMIFHNCTIDKNSKAIVLNYCNETWPNDKEDNNMIIN